MKSFHGRVFTRDEITKVVQTYRLPENRWKLEEVWRCDRFIEAQIWDVRPIEKFLRLQSEVKSSAKFSRATAN